MAAYNQTLKGQSVRIGNWYEELKLKEDTGVRYYPEPKNKQNNLLTKARCIEHTERIEPKQYTTITRDTLKDPRSYPNYSHLTSAGPKRRLIESTIRAEIEEEVKRKAEAEYKESRIVDYSTTGKQWFKSDSFRESLRVNDPNVRVNTRNTSYSTDTAITYYSHALKNTSERVNFPATFVGSVNPFSRHNAFSADIAHDTLARRTETYERPRGVPTLHEYKILNAFKEKLLSEGRKIVGDHKGAAVRFAADQLLSLELELIPFAELKDFIAARFSGLHITEAEERAMKSAYDYKSNGVLFLPELIWFVRPSPARRRTELIEHFFALMPSPQQIERPDSDPIVIISSEAVLNQLKYSGLPPTSVAYQEVTRFLDHYGDSFSFLDFFDYFADISAEVEDDYVYEEFMRSVWETILG